MRVAGIKQKMICLFALLATITVVQLCRLERSEARPRNPDLISSDSSDESSNQSPVRKSLRDVNFSQFNHLDPQHLVPDNALERAVAYFAKNRSAFSNQRYLAIVDFTKSANSKRFYVINMETGQVRAHAVAHGRGSDPRHTGRPTYFSNSPGSSASSIGFYKTEGVYFGKHGVSLRLDGLSRSTSNARARAIVVHAADYVANDSNAWGRSQGCFALDPDVTKNVINQLKGGALIYAYAGQGSQRRGSTRLAALQD